jgi:hypothetical protein
MIMAQTAQTAPAAPADPPPAAEPKKPTLEQRVTWLEQNVAPLIGEAPTTVPESK